MDAKDWPKHGASLSIPTAKNLISNSNFFVYDISDPKVTKASEPSFSFSLEVDSDPSDCSGADKACGDL